MAALCSSLREQQRRSESKPGTPGRGAVVPTTRYGACSIVTSTPISPRPSTSRRKCGINLAISNPCLELWFVLHFEDQTSYLERYAAQRRAEELLGSSKVLSESALTTLADGYEEARRRAIKLDEKHAGDGSPPRSNPSSAVWRLIDMIRNA
ncbi:MAG: hypothetical protein DLM62_01280 [Pseudonocardiales bacterium]|nr:MAG: hypothetical protein DLM62_01280 [Pseudonocardiales bacterium]